MTNKVIQVGRFDRYADEIRDLKGRKAELEKLNLELGRRLDELYGDYLELRYAMKGMASEAEILALRKKILELQNTLRLQCAFARKH